MKIPTKINTPNVTKRLTSIMLLLFVASIFQIFTTGAINAQTVVIPECPSVSDFPKKGILDSKKSKLECDEQNRKEQESTPKSKVKKPKKS